MGELSDYAHYHEDENHAAQERIAQLTAERDALRDALAELLDLGEWMWSEADDKTLLSIYLTEKDYDEFNALAQVEAR